MPISSFLTPSAIAKAGVCTSSTRPASPYEGQVIYETDTDDMLVWNGSSWIKLVYVADNENLSTTGNYTANGTITGGNLTTSGTVTGGSITTGGTVTATGTVTGGNLSTGGTVTATGTITGGNLTTSGTVTGSIVNSSTYRKSGTDRGLVGRASTALTFTTTPTMYVINLPSGVNSGNLISVVPISGVNNTLTIYEIRVGDWSGVQTNTQVGIVAALGNGVHTEPFTIYFYFYV
jgi:hypothetical protein